MRRALNLRLALQALAMKVAANTVVQLLARWKAPDTAVFDWQQVAEFAVYGFVGSQVGNVVQYVLEDLFPAPQAAADALPRHADAPQLEAKKDDDSAAPPRRRCCSGPRAELWRNVLAKLVLDQTFGLAISGCVFLFCTNILRVPHPVLVLEVLRRRLWPLIKAGWHIWPLVALCNFLWVPLRSRVLVSVCVGFGWSIFLSVFVRQ